MMYCKITVTGFRRTGIFEPLSTYTPGFKFSGVKNEGFQLTVDMAIISADVSPFREIQPKAGCDFH